MTTMKCRKRKCEHYKTTSMGIGGVDLRPQNGRCVLADRQVQRMKECPLDSSLRWNDGCEGQTHRSAPTGNDGAGVER